LPERTYQRTFCIPDERTTPALALPRPAPQVFDGGAAAELELVTGVMTAAVSPGDCRRAALAAGKKSLRPGRRLIFVGWPMPGERDFWAADSPPIKGVG
jgi:hypothetical protein